MKVGIVTRYYPPIKKGGSHISVYHIAEGLAEKGIDVSVFTSAIPEDMAGGEINRNVKIYRIFNYNVSENLLELDRSSITMARELRKFLKKYTMEFDILHAYGMDTIPAIWFNRNYGKTVASMNSYWATCPFWDHTINKELCFKCSLRKLSGCVFSKSSGNFIKKTFAIPYLRTSLTFKKYITKRLDLLLPISESVKNILIQNGFASEKMKVCYNMLDPDKCINLNKHFLHELLNLDPSTKIILYAGRFAEYKGVEYIIGSIPEVKKRFDDVMFVFLGRGEGRKTLEDSAKRLKVEDSVIFGPFIDWEKMPDAYASSYCVVMPSTWPEPFARVPIEALSSGTAIIATDIGGTSEIVIDGTTGLLVKPFSSIEISDAILMVLNNEEMRNRLIKNGRDIVLKRHSMHNYVNNYIYAYEEIL